MERKVDQAGSNMAHFFSDPVSITLYKTIPEPFSQLAKSSFVFNAGNWWLSQISWLTDATNHKKNVSHVCEKKEMIQIQSSKICPNISDTVNSSRPYEKSSFYFLIFLEVTKKFPPLLFGWKNFERESRAEMKTLQKVNLSCQSSRKSGHLRINKYEQGKHWEIMAD